MRVVKTFVVSVVLAIPMLVSTSPAGGDQADPLVLTPPSVLQYTEIGRATIRPLVSAVVSPGGVNGADPAGAEDRRYDVQVSRAPMRAARPGPWVDVQSYGSNAKLTSRIGSGQVLCVRARQHSWGLVSDWSPRDCVVRALDDRRLRSLGRVAQVPDRRYVDGHATRTWDGATLRLPRVPRGVGFGFVVTRVPDPGYCRVGDISVASTRPPDGYDGLEGRRGVQFWFTKARRAGAGVYYGETGGCRVGGAIVVPRWLGWKLE